MDREVSYLRALLYLLTAAFQSWLLKSLFPIFFTSSATDRTWSTLKHRGENQGKIHVKQMFLSFKFGIEQAQI